MNETRVSVCIYPIERETGRPLRHVQMEFV